MVRLANLVGVVFVGIVAVDQVFSGEFVKTACAQAGEIEFVNATSQVDETAGQATIELMRSGGDVGDVTARIALSDITTTSDDYTSPPYIVDPYFNVGTGTNNPVWAIAVQDDGKILIGGTFSEYNGASVPRFARLNPDGTLDSAFQNNIGTGPSGLVRSIAIQDDGKILIGHFGFEFNGVTSQRGLARINPDGTVDTNFTSNFNDVVRSIAVQPDGRIVVGGWFTQHSWNTPAPYIARIHPDGSYDTSFQVEANDYVEEVVLQDDGKILIGGRFTEVNNVARSHIARFNANGTLDNSFNPDPDGWVLSAIVLDNDQILIGGTFSEVQSTPRRSVARLYEDGTLDTSFDTGDGAETNTGGGIIYDMGLQGGKIVVCGSFTQFDGEARNNIARLQHDGSLDPHYVLTPGSTSTFLTMAVQDDHKVLFGNWQNLWRFAIDWTVSWSDGEQGVRTITLPIHDRVPALPNRSLRLNVFVEEGAATVGSIDEHTLTIVDTSPVPSIESLTTEHPDGIYGIGTEIEIDVSFSEPVDVLGTPQLVLNSGGTAQYLAGSGTDELTFHYIVAPGEQTPSLETLEATSLDLNGGAIDGPTVPADITLPIAGNPESLSGTSDITIDALAPTVAVNAAPGQENPTETMPVRFEVTFSKPVVDFGVAALDLSASTAADPVILTITPEPSTVPSATSFEIEVQADTHGEIAVTVPAQVVHDEVGNPNTSATQAIVTVESPQTPDAEESSGCASSPRAKRTHIAGLLFFAALLMLYFRRRNAFYRHTA